MRVAVITSVSKTWRFDAAHTLPYHDGKCAQPHGHTYSATVTVEGSVQPVDGRAQGGMVVDFGILDAVWQTVELLLDHRDLNVTLADRLPATTSEHLAAWLFGRFTEALEALGVRVVSVRVSETPSTYAEVNA